MPTDTGPTARNIATDLKDLVPLAQRLNAATDELNQSLQTIQDKLNTMGLGVEVWLPDPLRESPWRDILDRDSEPTGRREYDADELGYGRLGNGWALLVRRVRYVDTDAANARATIEAYDDNNRRVGPLLHVSRELRVTAVGRIHRLIDELRAESSKVIDAVEQAKRIADSLK
jgi:hypothetical protein